MIKLYQFPISHYCEKVRWALAYKKIDHQLINILPGFHAKKMLKLTGKHSVPVIQDKDRAIANSADIISYLEEKYPEHSLTPSNPDEKAQALAWEKLADDDIGPHVRKICYFTLLNHPQIVIKFFTQGGPWYGPLLIKLIFPQLQKKMRKLMKINEASVKESQLILETALEKVFHHLDNNKYLVGNSFTRADLAVASLLAPFCGPEKYGLQFPENYPEPLASYIKKHQDKLEWVRHIYQLHR